MLNENGGGTDWWTWAMIGGFALLIVGMIFFQSKRRRRHMEHQQDMMNRLRSGMRIKTVAGTIGRIKEIREESNGLKTILLETGTGKDVSYLLMDVQAILNIMDEDRLIDDGSAPATALPPIPDTEFPKKAEATEPQPEATAEPNPMHEKYEEMKAEAEKAREEDFNAGEFVTKSNSTRKSPAQKKPSTTQSKGKQSTSKS